MWTFGKKKMEEQKAVALFLIDIMKNTKEQWPNISTELNDTLRLEQQIPNSPSAGFEFAIAVIAIQVQAIRNLLPQDQSHRIIRYMVDFFTSSEGYGEYVQETLQFYQNAWDQCLSKGEMPLEGVASILFDKLECQSAVELSGVKFKDPLLLLALTEKITFFGGPWWKNLIAKYKLVP